MSRLPPNPTLTPLEPLIGAWKVEVPQFGGHGREVFEWLEGAAFLRCQADAPDPVPSGTLIIGRDDSTETFTALYYDSRGVSRVYQMSFGNGVWRMWREAPGFWQRFSATFEADGSIRGAWEKSLDGSSWEHDFDMIYTRLG